MRLRLAVLIAATLLSFSLACSDDDPVGPAYEYLDVPGEFATIQAAVDAAEAGDTILVAAGTYSGAGNRDIGILGKAINLKSAKGYQQTIIDCGGAESPGHRGLLIQAANGSSPYIHGFTIIGARMHPEGQPYDENHSGGAVNCSGGAPTFRNCVFTGSSAVRGGGVYLDDSNALFVFCRFESNFAEAGAGLYARNSIVTVNDCVFEDNSTTGGGSGGGVFTYRGMITVKYTLFDENSAFQGAAFQIENGDADLVNCTFYRNAGAAAIFCERAFPDLVNLIIAGTLGGEAVSGVEPYLPVLRCCDLYGNTGGDWVGLIEGQQGRDGNFSADPKLLFTPGREFFISYDSPCASHNNECGVLIGAYDVGNIETD